MASVCAGVSWAAGDDRPQRAGRPEKIIAIATGPLYAKLQEQAVPLAWDDTLVTVLHAGGARIAAQHGAGAAGMARTAA